MKEKIVQFINSKNISDDSDSEISNKLSFNFKKKFDQITDNIIKCFLRIRPLSEREKESMIKIYFFL